VTVLRKVSRKVAYTRYDVSWFVEQMDFKIGVFHAPAASPPKIEPSDPLDRRLGGLQNRPERGGENLLVSAQTPSNKRSRNNGKMAKYYETKRCL
jgi:hypothetical protein